VTFRTADELLARQMAGDARPPAAEQLDMRLVRFARGVAVYEIPLRDQVRGPSGAVAGGVLTSLAEAAMTAAATSAVADGSQADPHVVEMVARFDRAVDAGEAESLRAEAVVMRTDARSTRVEAEVHCDGVRAASFEAVYTRQRRVPAFTPGAAGERPLAHA
jgi:uncharacterized protein (TIGR00369 family)